jgi:zinc/manganese transport system substrate-binding protein
MGIAMAGAVLGLGALGVMGAGCGGGDAGTSATTTAADRPVIAATTPILGAVVREAVGDGAEVRVIMPNGSDPHEWRPSAKDVAALQEADLVVENGLDLEEGLEDAIDQARKDGTPVFTATEHVTVRKQGGEPDADRGDDDHAHGDDDHGHGDDDHGHGAGDPHFWTDPAQVRSVTLALPGAVKKATGVDVSATSRQAARQLAAVDRAIATDVAAIPEGSRNLVTGHESLGYFADRYGLQVIGAVTPSLSSQGQVSAAHLAALEAAMTKAGVKVLFTETGLSDAVADAVVKETGATVVEVGTEVLPEDGSYRTYMKEMGRRISSALADPRG